MVTATFHECAECGTMLGDTDDRKYYGNGAVRCMPGCVKKFERRLNKRRGVAVGSRGRAEMHAHADPIPCHHPAWPRRCPNCGNPADGFNVTVPLERRWDADVKEMRWWAWGTSGMACIKCHIAIIPDTFKEPGTVKEGITEEYVRSLIEADLTGVNYIRVMPTPWFKEHCCLPAKEPENVEAYTK